MLCAARFALATAGREELEEALQQDLDWDRLLGLANAHGLMPLLYRSICKSHFQEAPAEWLGRLRTLYLQGAARNMRMTGELLRLLALLESGGIEAAAYKGPALAQQIYGDITLRTFCDLDIIIRREDVLPARDMLLREGYRPEYSLTPAQEKAYLRSQCEYNFDHQARGIHVEMHWLILPTFYSIPFDASSVWSRMGTMSLEGQRVRTLYPEDLVIALCLHHAKHSWNWNQLKSLCDIAGLIQTQKDLRWDRVRANAREQRVERILLLELMLAKNFLGAGIPEEMAKQAEDDKAIMTMASEGQRLLFANQQLSPTLRDGIHFWLLARERRRDNLSCMLRLAFSPLASDVAAVALPERLYPLYYLIHPVRMGYNSLAKGKVG